jgi:hypothetical protein
LLAKRIDFICQRTSAKRSVQQHQAFALTACQRILEILGRMGVATETLLSRLQTIQAQRQFQHILDRALADNALPVPFRSLTPACPIEDRVGLIHQIAHQYSINNTRTQREIWRAIYFLYRYLQANSLPIGPVFSKAVVRSSITRPLSENHFISARRLVWVCQLVARVEGEEAAKKVESAFWYWRGDLIKHAKDVYVAAGGDRRDKAHVGTMRKLRLI